MMMIPRKHDFDLFDDVFGDSFFNEGASRLMKTDIKEKKNEYIIDIDLPGYDKEGIKLEIQDGYLTVHASVNKEENDEEKIVAALVTSIIAAEQAQHTNFHVRSIKRVK